MTLVQGTAGITSCCFVCIGVVTILQLLVDQCLSMATLLWTRFARSHKLTRLLVNQEHRQCSSALSSNKSQASLTC